MANRNVSLKTPCFTSSWPIQSASNPYAHEGEDVLCPNRTLSMWKNMCNSLCIKSNGCVFNKSVNNEDILTYNDVISI